MNAVAKNASWIVICKIVQSILALVINMLTARYLGPSNYGLITYAASLVAFVVPIMQLGFNNILVQELVVDPKKEGAIVGTSISLSFATSIICYFGIILFSFIANRHEPVTQIVCMLYSILLMFQAIDLVEYWFQAKLLSKYSSLISLFAYITVSVYKVIILVTEKSVYWFALSNTFDILLISIGSIIVYHHVGGSKLSYSWELGKKLFAKSKHYIIAGLMVTIFSQTDKIMIKLMIGEDATGYYGAAVAITGMTGFVFSALIDSFRPVIFEGKSKDELLYESRLKMLYSMIIYLSIVQCVLITILAWYIIRVLYGVAYLPAANALRIVSWYTVFSYIGAVRNIWILAENKQHYLWIINLSGALCNIVLNLLLIPIIGIEGAAIASLLTQLFANVIIGFLIRPFRNNNKLMFEALKPSYIIQACKSIKQ